MKKAKVLLLTLSAFCFTRFVLAEDNPVKIFSDVAFRYHGYYDVDTTYLNDLEMKFRLGASKKVNERITAFLRFDTGPQNTPTGTWITMGDRLHKTSFLL